MAIRDLFKSRADQAWPPQADEYSPDSEAHYKNDEIDISNNAVVGSDGGSASDATQDGVKKIQATTIVWTKRALITAYALYATHKSRGQASANTICSIFLIFFVNSFQEQVSSNLSPYVTSSFAEHELTATTSVVSTLVAGIIKLPVAKMMDVWGREQGFLLMLSCAVIGKAILSRLFCSLISC